MIEEKRKAIWIVLSTRTTPGKVYDVTIKKDTYWHTNDQGDWVPSDPSCWKLIDVADELKFNRPI